MNQERRLAMQSLEGREMMAGDVFFGRGGGDSRDLVIRGDNLDNQIEITSPQPGQLRVRGLNGTRVNGLTAGQTLSFQDDVSIQMMGGADRVEMGGVRVDGRFHSDMNIDMGSGSDQLTMIAGNGTAFEVRRNLNINMGSGHDDLFMQNFDVGRNLSIVGGADNDDIELLALDIGNELGVRTDAGRDDVKVRESDAANMFIRTGRDKDEVLLRDSEAADQMFVDLGEHDDVLRLFGNDAARPTFRGGTGSDHMIYGYYSDKNDFDPWGFRSSFEYRQRQ